MSLLRPIAWDGELHSPWLCVLSPDLTPCPVFSWLAEPRSFPWLLSIGLVANCSGMPPWVSLQGFQIPCRSGLLVAMKGVEHQGLRLFSLSLVSVVLKSILQESHLWSASSAAALVVFWEFSGFPHPLAIGVFLLNNYYFLFVSFFFFGPCNDILFIAFCN